MAVARRPRFRCPNDKVDAAALREAWLPWARDLAFDWSFRGYTKILP